MIENIAKISEWSDSNALAAAFTGIDIFTSIYIPVKTPTAEGMPDNFTYTNIGLDYSEIADAYNTIYGSNYLSTPLHLDNLIQSTAKLKAKIQSIYKLNKGKYLKMIELSGYTYNPLFNVDGIEQYTSLSNEGTNDITKQLSFTQHTDTTTSNNTRSGSISDSGSSSATHEDTNSVTSFDSTDLSTTDHNSGNNNITSSSNTQTYNNLSDNGGGSVSYGAHTDTDTTTVTHHNALNGSAEYSGGDDLFGNSVTGGDKYHNEKRLRQGNIGVTKTQELIEAERANLRFSIIQEFFDDINKVILVGIYDL